MDKAILVGLGGIVIVAVVAILVLGGNKDFEIILKDWFSFKSGNKKQGRGLKRKVDSKNGGKSGGHTPSKRRNGQISR